jgi:carboxymethylenebutenolidase
MHYIQTLKTETRAMNDKDSQSRPNRRTFAAAGAAALALTMAGSAVFAASATAKVNERNVSVTTPDGKADAVLFSPAKPKTAPAILLWPDLGGMRPAVRAWGRELAAAGYVVLMPNAYYRSGPPAAGEVNLADADVRKRQMDYRAAATDEGVTRDAAAYVAFLDAQKQTDKRKKIGTLGYDVGGGYAIRTAVAAPDRVGAVGIVYGLGVATPRPNSPHLLIPKTKAAYYVIQSKDDDAREPDDKTDIKKAIVEGGLQGTVEVSTANHGFATPGSPAADAVEAARVKAELLKLLKARL